MLDVVLYEPEIPPNTGNIIRLCANTGFGLYLIHPLGFELDDKRARRAGLDYHELAPMKDYPTLQDYLDAQKPLRIFAMTTKGQRPYHDVAVRGGGDWRPFSVDRDHRPDAPEIMTPVAAVYGIMLTARVTCANREAYQTAVWLLRRMANEPLNRVAVRFGVSAPRISKIQAAIESIPFPPPKPQAMQ